MHKIGNLGHLWSQAFQMRDTHRNRLQPPALGSRPPLDSSAPVPTVLAPYLSYEAAHWVLGLPPALKATVPDRG